MKCTLIRLDNGQPFVAEAVLVTNPDNSVSFQLPNGGYAGQEPNQVGQSSTYGVRHDQAPGTGAAQSYQRATLVGSVVTFVTRPQDLPCVYLFGTGQAF